MSQKFNKVNQPLINPTGSFNKYEEKNLLFNFTYCLAAKTIDNTNYAKVFKTILTHSQEKTKDFSKNIKIEYNETILKRQVAKNQKFILELYNGDATKFKAIHDIVRKDSLRAYGNLIKNIFYVLEIDPNHKSR